MSNAINVDDDADPDPDAESQPMDSSYEIGGNVRSQDDRALSSLTTSSTHFEVTIGNKRTWWWQKSWP